MNNLPFSNVTFVTHLRYDSDDRFNNLQTVMDYYSTNFEGSKFILVEDDKEHNTKYDNIKWPKKRTSFYLIKNEGVYYRTRALNYGISLATTEIVVSLDTDCIVPVESFKKCVDNLLDDATIAWPYNGFFVDTSLSMHSQFLQEGSKYDFLKKQLPPIDTLYLLFTNQDFHVRSTHNDHQSVGGIVMFNKQRFLEMGGYNEKFIAWGAEDNELYSRSKILEHKTFRDTDMDSVCFHLYHANAIRNNHPFYQSNFDEAGYVESLNKEQLQEYIKTWNNFK
jgi:predicted glycosyltransferase involved in capsule biosynthesis